MIRLFMEKGIFPGFVLLILLAFSFFSCDHTEKSLRSNSSEQIFLVDYVNPLMGTDSKYSLSNGNTYPAIATPWGMNFWTPMTSDMGDGWTYKYNENKIRGIKQTHQPSPWINDYAAFSLMAPPEKILQFLIRKGFRLNSTDVLWCQRSTVLRHFRRGKPLRPLSD